MFDFFIAELLKKMNVKLIKFNKYMQIFNSYKNFNKILKIVNSMPNEKFAMHANIIKESKSQFGQDIFVLLQLDFKENGFFVDFGATNGLDLSNTFVLEKFLGWSGILAEPAKIWHHNLKLNRNSHIEEKCVWSKTGETLKFNESNIQELSTILDFSNVDMYKNVREKGKIYEVETISLIDLLVKYNAPAEIDYLSIDTEGSEYDILKNFDFKKYTFKVITCEHNFTPQRERIYKLLTENGYTRVFENLSEVDDWYILSR